MSEVKLKPCPFCGGEAQIQCVPNYGMEGKYYYGLCLKCHSKTQARPAEISAAVDWNTRRYPFPEYDDHNVSGLIDE